MTPNSPGHRRNTPPHNDYLMIASVLLVAVGLIGIGAVQAKLLLLALPAAAILLLLIPNRAPAASRKHAAGRKAGSGEQTADKNRKTVPLQLVHRKPGFPRTPVRETHAPHPLQARALDIAAAADKDIRHLRKIADRLDDASVSASIRGLCAMAEAIGDNLKADPGVLPTVQRFYDYYLRTAKMLWSQYEVLVRSPFYNKEMEFQVKRIENLMEPLHRNFERHLARSMRGELGRVELEVNTLERVMRSEG